MAMNLAPPRKSLQLHSLEKGKIDVLSLLHHLHTAPITQRDVLVRALHDLSPSEIDSILPQLIHLWTQWEDSAALGLRDFFLAQCATSQYFTLRIMFNLQAEEAHAAAGSQTIPRIRSLLKLSEMAHVNAELPKEAQSKHHSQPQQQPTSTAAARRSSAAELPSRASTSQQLPQVDPNRRMSAAMPNRSASTGSVLSKSQSVQQPTPLSQSVRSSTQPLLSTNVPSPSSINLPGRNGGAMMPVALNRYVKLVQVSIVPATISAPINAVVSVLIKPTVLASPSNPASTVVHASSPALVRGSSPSPQQQHQQQLQKQRQQPNIMLGGSDPRRNSNAHQRPDGPSVAFTSDNSWRPSPSASPNRSPAPPRHSPQNMRNSPTPHTVLAANDNFSLNSFPVPPGGHNHPTSPQPLSSSSSTSPPVIQVIRRSASEKATPTPPPPALTRNLSNEEVETLNEFFAAHAPSASPTTIATTISPTAVNKDAEDLDVDWPANDDNLPTGTPSTAPTTSSSKNNNTLAKPTPSSGSTSVSPAPIPLPYRSASSGVHLHSANPSDTSKLGVEESVLFHLLSKQVRSEYFNLQLLFFSALHDLSVLLTHVALADRNRVLREQLTAIDTSICRGLYFPIVPYSSVESQTHYRILRLLPDECWSLASRDKAPFLLHMEIAYAEAPKSAFAGEVTRAMSTYDSDIYTIFKSNEQIMADALSAAAASSSFSPATQPAGDKLSANLSPPIMSGATNSPGDAPAIARETAAHIAQMKDATPTPVASSTVTSPAVSHSDNLHSNPAANIQANGLNIVADGLDESTAATNSSTPSGSKTLTRKHSSAETVMDVDGKPITRSRSSSQLQLSRQSSSNSNVADEESDIVQELVTTAPSKHGAEASTTPTKPTHGYSYSVSVPSSPRQSKGNLGVDEIATETKNLRLDASTPTAAPPQPAASAPAHASAAKSTTTAATTPAAAASSAASAAASTTPSASAKPAPLKGTRFVPSANPHRPRRSSTYQSGPSLCDVDFPLLNAAYGESFQAKKNRVYSLSPFKSTCQPPTWDLISVIFKGGDDLRQEVLAMQFINAFDRIFKASNLPIYLRPYAVMITSADSGLIETIPNAVSVDSLKKRLFPSWTCLTDFYAAYFRGIEIQSIILGPEEFLKKYPCEFGIVNYSTALRNFVESMAGYSIVCYLLQVKDRHNGNIMIDRAGHVVHIDWGFLLSNSPGGNWNFEQAPFKLTQEYLDVMGGVHSDLFAYFKMLVTRGFLEARAHVDEFVALGSIHARTSKMPCFMGPISYASPNGVIDAMRARFAMHLKSESEVEKFVEGLIESSIDNWRTVRYDSYQKLVSGIL